VLSSLENVSQKDEWVNTIINERKKLKAELEKLSFVEKVYPSDANFLLVKMASARDKFQYLMNEGVIVRDRSKVTLCDNSLRITVGKPEDNTSLINTLLKIENGSTE